MQLFIYNISYDVTARELDQALREFGVPTNVRIAKDKATGKSRGFGFAEMNDEDARCAIDTLDHTMFYGRELKIREADDRPPKRKK